MRASHAISERRSRLGSSAGSSDSARSAVSTASTPRLSDHWILESCASSPRSAAARELGVDLVERALEQHLGAFAVAGDAVRGRRERQQIDVARAGSRRVGVRHAGPQLERPFGELGGLAVGVDVARRERGLDRGAQRGRLVARGGVVAGDRGGQLELSLVAAAIRSSSARASARCSSPRSPGSRSS